MKLYNLTPLETLFFSEIAIIIETVLFILFIICTSVIIIGMSNKNRDVQLAGGFGFFLIAITTIALAIIGIKNYQNHNIQYISMDKKVPIIDIQKEGELFTNKYAIIEIDGKKYKYALHPKKVATKGDMLRIKSNKDLVLYHKDNRIIKRNPNDRIFFYY